MECGIAYFVLFSSLVSVYCKKEREREGQCLIHSPSSIEYRYSPSPSPSSVFLRLFFEKFVLDCVLLFLCVAASPHMPSSFFFSFFFIIFSSLRLASRFTHCSPQGDPRPLVVLSIPYRTILQRVSSSPSNSLTNQPSFRNLLMVGTVQCIYLSDRKAARSTEDKKTSAVIASDECEMTFDSLLRSTFLRLLTGVVWHRTEMYVID
jgi:hypothetical protein